MFGKFFFLQRRFSITSRPNYGKLYVHRKTFHISQTRNLFWAKFHPNDNIYVFPIKGREFDDKMKKFPVRVNRRSTYIFCWPLVPTLPFSFSFSLPFPFNVPLPFDFTFPILLLDRWQRLNRLNVTFFSIVIRWRMCNWWCCGRPWLRGQNWRNEKSNRAAPSQLRWAYLIYFVVI